MVLMYRGVIVATVTDKIRLTPRLAATPATDPERRVAFIMGMYAMKLRQDGAADEYNDTDAAQLAEDALLAEGEQLPPVTRPLPQHT